MVKSKVLFVCIHNSARSQMAEAFVNRLCGDVFDAESAGFEPGLLNPIAVEAMQEIGIDISSNETKSAFDLFKARKLYDYVITVCDEASAEACPVFPGITQRLHWSASRIPRGLSARTKNGSRGLVLSATRFGTRSRVGAVKSANPLGRSLQPLGR